jgi:cytidylate kinase
MWDNIGYGKCEFFIESYFESKRKEAAGTIVKPAITISRLEGAGGHTVASNLAEYMQQHIPTHDVWAVFDRNLVEKALEDHNLHKRIAGFIKEDHKGMLTDAVEEWLGLHPSTWTLVEKINATILRLAEMGNVIMLGRGGSIVTRDLQNVFRVRLVGSLEKRIEQIKKVYNLDQKAAQHFIKKEDEGSRRYVKDNFDKDIDDPLLYHITINTDMVKYDEAARLIGEEVIKHFKLDRSVKSTGSRSSLT